MGRNREKQAPYKNFLLGTVEIPITESTHDFGVGTVSMATIADINDNGTIISKEVSSGKNHYIITSGEKELGGVVLTKSGIGIALVGEDQVIKINLLQDGRAFGSIFKDGQEGPVQRIKNPHGPQALANAIIHASIQAWEESESSSDRQAFTQMRYRCQEYLRSPGKRRRVA